MLVVGLTGGIASGKSTFANALRALGTPVIDADELARVAVAKGSPGLDALVAEFGKEILTPSGELDRRRMGERAFADPVARTRLEAVIHPLVHELFRAERARLATEGHSLCVYDVPLLFEAKLEHEVDLSVVVWAPHEVQIARLEARNGLTRAAAEARLAAQLPLDEKAARADVVIANDGDLSALERKARHVLEDIGRGLARRLSNGKSARY
ncbi:MAG TPA: dephospho-CoA kinase [Anaeromyxobacteraceae bacterium]|nr:dephospho-CoA kinase [Anaeromyxobacteraceae bacterium]